MGVGPSHNDHNNHDQSREVVEEEFDDNGLDTACCWFNQRLSPELQLLIFRHLEPQKDSQTVSLVCKYWNELYADEHLWRHFHEREFGRAPVRPPTSFFPDEIYSGAAPTKDGSTSSKQLSWRLSYTYTSSQMKSVFAERRRRIKWLLRFAQITKPTAPDLFFAVHNSLHVLLSRLLLLHSPRTINKAEQHGRSLLFSAAELGDITSVQMLLAHGADPTLSCVCTTPLPVHLTSSTSPSSSLSASPPTLASSRPSISSPPSTSTVSSTFSSFLSSFSSPYPSNYPFTKTPLLVATERGDLDMVRLLLTNGAQPSIDCVGFKGHTPLSLAASKGHIEVAKLLLDNGAQVELPSSSSSYPWIKNPLHRAVLKGHPEIVSLLLRHGADPNKVMCSIRYVPPMFTRAIRSYHGTPLQQLLYKTDEDHLINVRCVELLMGTFFLPFLFFLLFAHYSILFFFSLFTSYLSSPFCSASLLKTRTI
ncbi:Ankyrin repeat domain-containing protein [Balamuthia mandrillaris]